VKLAGFAAALAVLFAGGALAGEVTDPDSRGSEPAAATHGHESEMTTETHTEKPSTDATEVHGLGVADDGLRVEVEQPELRLGRAEKVRFRIVDEHGEPVRDFDVTHEKRMHLIVARRDLRGFQHLHPQLGADGTWTAPVTLDEAGSYRLFADFSHKGEARTLATDLRVDGDADLQPLPEPKPVAQSDGGYDVRLDASGVKAGAESSLRFTITRDGEPIRTEPYLGAGGHLVALREGDLAFLHVHPISDDSVAFAATFPTEGRYRLFLQFKHEGRVQTVAFTQAVGR